MTTNKSLYSRNHTDGVITLNAGNGDFANPFVDRLKGQRNAIALEREDITGTIDVQLSTIGKYLSCERFG